MSDVSFLAMNLQDVKDLEPVPEDEYEVQVAGVEDLREGQDWPRLNVALTVLGQPNASTVYYPLFMPRDEDDQQRQQGALRKIKYFCDGFGIDYSSGGINTEDFQGKSGRVRLILERNEEYGDRNKVTRVIRPS